VGRLAAAVGIETADAFSLFDHFNPGLTLPQRGKRISSGQYSPPSFEMTMARKDLRLMVEEAARGGQTLAVIPAWPIAVRMWSAPAWGTQPVRGLPFRPRPGCPTRRTPEYACRATRRRRA